MSVEESFEEFSGKFLRSELTSTFQREHFEQQDYEARGLEYVSGFTDKDILWNLAARGRKYGISTPVSIQPLYTREGIKILPGNLIMVQGNQPKDFLDFEAPSPNLHHQHLPEIVPPSRHYPVDQERCYVAVFNIVNPEAFLSFEEPGLQVRGPGRTLLMPTFVGLRKTG